MDWSNWIYLGLGLVAGFAVRSLFVRSSASLNLSHNKTVNQPQIKKNTQLNFANGSSTYKNLSPNSGLEQGLEQQLKQAQLAYEMAREMSLFKAGFLARTTHELRSPLNGLINLHQLILSDLCEDAAEEREFISQAHERALILLRLMDEILKIARTEHGTNKLDIQPTDLGQVLKEVYNLTYMLAANRNYPLHISPPDPEIYVLADPIYLKQVLLNLIYASITQMEEGSISVSTEASSDANGKSMGAVISLDIPSHAICESESIDLIESKNKYNEESSTHIDNTNLSPGMKLLINQTLLEIMGGNLQIVSSPISQDTMGATNYSRIQVSIPLATPPAVPL
jgi:signal transduction histidine kinase